MPFIKYKSVRTRLTSWFLLLTLIPMLTVLIITYFQRVSVIKTTTFNKLTAIRDLKVEILEEWLKERAGDLKTASTDNELALLENIIDKNKLNSNDISILDNIRRILNRYLSNYSSYNELFIINPRNGRIIASTKRYMEGEDKTDDSYYKIPMQSQELYIRDVYNSKTLLRNAMAYSIPIFCAEHDGEHIVGIMVARIDLENTLYPILSDRVGLGKTGETLIVNKDAVAINELRWYERAPLNLKINAEAAVNAAQGKTGIIVTEDYRGELVLAAYTHIPITGWGFVSKQDMHELNAPIREMINYFIFMFLIFSVLITLISIFIGKTISLPLLAMDKVARQISSGDFSVRNSITSHDEVGSLASEFNHMADLTESRLLIQQGASEISDAIIGKTSLHEFGFDLIKQLKEITKADLSVFYILNEVTQDYEHYASIGGNADLLKPFNATFAMGELGNAISQKEIYYLQNIPQETIFTFLTTAGELIPKDIITIPVLIDNNAVALISLVKVTNFSSDSIQILNESWTNINLSFSGLMGSERTRVLSEHLSSMNEQLEAQTEELQEKAEEMNLQAEKMQLQADELHITSEELQEQNIELDRQRIQVVEANRLKSEFLSNMSHELRTPLNSILALSRVLLMRTKDKISEEESEYLGIVERNGKQLLTLINDILDLSKIEAGKMDMQVNSCSLETLLRNITDSLQPLVMNKDLNIQVNIANELPRIETDEAKLYQILQNIIGNSVKFTDKGYININLKSDTEKVIIEVIDSGIGILQKDIPYIFDEFRQVDGSSSRKHGGTGLGLTIVHKLVKILQGDIRVKSRVGEGTEFTLTIPLKWQVTDGLEDSQTIQTIVSEANRKTVLVVDDNPHIVKQISKYLEISGYNTIGSTSGKDALEIAEKHQPFAITLDVVMPEMDGWEVLQELKRNSKTKDIPVIVVSISDSRDTGFAMGAIGFIQKPIDRKLLVSEINKLHTNPNYVMIVDDNEVELNEMSEIIQTEGIKTILAKNGKECLSLLQETIPDLLVLDLLMPDIDGFQILNEIRKAKATKNLPVIVVTAKDLSRRDKEILSGQVSTILTKSESTSQELFLHIKRILAELGENIPIAKKINSQTRILIVEDNEGTIVQVKEILEREKYMVDFAISGKQALEFVKHTIPDGIILDLLMPGIDGFEVLEIMRNSAETRNIPVLILTAKDLTKKDLSRLSSNNIQQLVHKGDIDLEGLLLKVKLMLGSSPNEKLKSSRQNLPDRDKNKMLLKTDVRVLIVEDNLDSMITLQAIIGDNYEILEAVDGEQALSIIAKEIPDLVLLDISLPKMDGIEVLKIIKASDELKDMPVIAVTARAMKEDREMLLAAGFDDYISKPVDQTLLLEAMRKLLRKTELHN